jgi:hypothetical protein
VPMATSTANAPAMTWAGPPRSAWSRKIYSMIHAVTARTPLTWTDTLVNGVLALCGTTGLEPATP